MFDRESPIYQQIIMHFEGRIFDGSLPAGSKIPSTTELARGFNVSAETVQTALKRLMERGLVDRRRGAGTFVRKGVHTRTVAIVFGENNFTRVDRAFFNILLRCLMRRLPASGWEFRHFITTEEPEADIAFHELEKSVADGSVRAVIEFCSNAMIKRWLDTQCDVPSSTRGACVDVPHLFGQALEHLMKLGRKDIAVVFGQERMAPEVHKAIAADLMGKHGPVKLTFVAADDTQRGGYSATQKLLATNGPRPDSILSLCDGATRGILFALMEKGVRVPQDMALITHANKGVEIFSNIPLTRLEIDPDKVAAELIDEITRKLEGKPYNQIPVRATLVAGLSCGEGDK